MDVLTDIPARDGHRLHHEDLAPGSELIEAPGFIIRAAGLSEIIASKEWADRPKDQRPSPSCARSATPGRPTIQPRRPAPPRRSRHGGRG
jgi:hypothetical protein